MFIKISAFTLYLIASGLSTILRKLIFFIFIRILTNEMKNTIFPLNQIIIRTHDILTFII